MKWSHSYVLSKITVLPATQPISSNFSATLSENVLGYKRIAAASKLGYSLWMMAVFDPGYVWNKTD